MATCPACGAARSAGTSACPACGRAPDEPPAVLADGEGASTSRSRSGPEGETLARGAMALGFAVFPALGAYVLVGLTDYDELLATVVAFPLLAALLYQRHTVARMSSSTLFWLAIEAFLAPVFALFYISEYVSSGNTSWLGRAVAGLQGGIFFVLACIVCIPLGVGFYVLSNRVASRSSTD